GCLGDDDVVETHRVVADDLELGTGTVEELGVDAIREQREDTVLAFHPPQQLVAWRWQLVGPYVRVGCLQDHVETVVGNSTAHKDARSVGHGGSPRRVAAVVQMTGRAGSSGPDWLQDRAHPIERDRDVLAR